MSIFFMTKGLRKTWKKCDPRILDPAENFGKVKKNGEHFEQSNRSILKLVSIRDLIKLA